MCPFSTPCFVFDTKRPKHHSPGGSDRKKRPKRSLVERRSQIAQILVDPICQGALGGEGLDGDPVVVADLAQGGEDLREIDDAGVERRPGRRVT
jgi:hypothetical protein